MRLVAIIPAYNEERRVAVAIADVAQFVDAVVVVDDCSYDNTHSVALDAGAYVLRHIINRGQGAALQTGTEFALESLKAEAIVHFDADGQMRGEDIPRLADALVQSGADIVLGSRFLGEAINMPVTRRLTLRAGLLFTTLVSGIRVSDTHNGFRLLSRKAAEEIVITINGMAHASEILDQIKAKKLRYTEHPVVIRYSEETLEKGQSFSGSFRIIKDFFTSKFFDDL